MRPVLSVIVPAFNVEAYVAETVKSVLGQTFNDLEVVIVNDGSTDRTLAIVNQFKQDPRVKIIDQVNRGCCGARNAGVKVALGEYIGFCDADDQWQPEKAALHIKKLQENPGIDLTFSWWKLVDERGNPTGRFKACKKSIELEDLLKENLIGSTSNVIVRRTALEAAGGFDESLRSNVDLDLWLRIVQLRQGNVACVEKFLVDYRIRPGQITKNWRQMGCYWNIVFNKVKVKFPERVSRIEKKARSFQERYLAHLAYEAGDFKGARKCLVNALLLHPAIIVNNHRWWLLTAAVLSTFLPGKIHDFISTKARKVWARRGEKLAFKEGTPNVISLH